MSASAVQGLMLALNKAIIEQAVKAEMNLHLGTPSDDKPVEQDFISSVTDEVKAAEVAWQNQPLEAIYPMVFFDALRVKIRSSLNYARKLEHATAQNHQDAWPLPVR